MCDAFFLKTKDNELDKLYKNIINEVSACTNVITSKFASSTISDQRKMYGDIEETAIKNLIQENETNNKRQVIAKNN